MRNPHGPYITAVVGAMPVGFTPSDWWVSDAETAEDGESATLSAVISWGRNAAPDLYPDGLILCWDLDREWQYAGMRSGGSNDPPADLPLPLWAEPVDVAAAARALLTDKEPAPSSGREWQNAAVKVAVKEWVES